MKKTLRAILCFFTALCVLGFAVGSDVAEAKRIVRVNGAGMASEQVQKWAEAFTTSHPDISVVVVGSSAGKGFETLFAGNADLALASRLINTAEQDKAKDKGFRLDSRLIGSAGMAIVTTKRNPVNELTLDQLKKIFTGEFNNWSQVGGPDEPIRCLARRIPQSGGAVFFMKTVLKNHPYAKTVVFTESWGSIAKVCEACKDVPIGIAPRMLAERSAVKIIRVKRDDQSEGILPTEKTMQAKTYPIIVPIRLYWDTKTEDDSVLKFVDYCEKKGLAKVGK